MAFSTVSVSFVRADFQNSAFASTRIKSSPGIDTRKNATVSYFRPLSSYVFLRVYH